MNLGDLVGIVRDYVDIYIDCEPVNSYIEKIYGSSEKGLFDKISLTDSRVENYYDNEVWSIDCKHSKIYIRDKDKKYRKK